MAELDNFIGRVVQYLVNPILGLLFAIAVMYFFFGVIKFLSNAEGGTGREEGKQSMIWGIIGIAIMATTYGIISLITGTIARI